MVITPPWRKLVAVAGLAVAIALTGCSGGGSSTTTTPAGSGSGNARSDAADQDAMVKFAQCMRQHGIDMPDPTVSPNGGAARMAIPAQKGDPNAMQKIQVASTACDKLLPNGGKPTNEDMQRSLKFAQCMRAHGVDMPDPNPNGGGKGITINGSDPKTKAALSACMPTGATK
jgi:hypothetical protein